MLCEGRRMSKLDENKNIGAMIYSTRKWMCTPAEVGVKNTRSVQESSSTLCFEI